MNQLELKRLSRYQDEIRPWAGAYIHQVAMLRAAWEKLHELGRYPGAQESDHTVEANVDADVYDAAMKRAQLSDTPLAVVGRALLLAAALRAEPDPDYDPTKRPRLRKHESGNLYRWRFDVPRELHRRARELIETSNQNVSAVLEEGLRHYALEGTILP